MSVTASQQFSKLSDCIGAGFANMLMRGGLHTDITGDSEKKSFQKPEVREASRLQNQLHRQIENLEPKTKASFIVFNALDSLMKLFRGISKEAKLKKRSQKPLTSTFQKALKYCKSLEGSIPELTINLKENKLAPDFKDPKYSEKFKAAWGNAQEMFSNLKQLIDHFAPSKKKKPNKTRAKFPRNRNKVKVPNHHTQGQKPNRTRPRTTRRFRQPHRAA